MIEIRTSPDLKSYDGKEWRSRGRELLLSVDADSLVGADLRKRRLDFGDLRESDLRNADFSHASLSGVNFSGANLSGASFYKAQMAGARFQGANVAGTDFSEAWMPGTKLQGVDFRSAKVETAKLRFARYDEETQWPEGFDAQERGAQLPHQWKENRLKEQE